MLVVCSSKYLNKVHRLHWLGLFFHTHAVVYLLSFTPSSSALTCRPLSFLYFFLFSFLLFLKEDEYMTTPELSHTRTLCQNVWDKRRSITLCAENGRRVPFSDKNIESPMYVTEEHDTSNKVRRRKLENHERIANYKLSLPRNKLISTLRWTKYLWIWILFSLVD